jgi:subfamily B ATP-binding cassette protein HlyB/CyaB
MSQPAHNPATVIECLTLLARHHGVDLTPERLAHDFALDGEATPHHLLVRMAQDNGLKAKVTTVSWDELAALGAAFPVLGLLANGNGVIFSGMREENGVLELAVIDPLADRPGFLIRYPRKTGGGVGRADLAAEASSRPARPRPSICNRPRPSANS